MLLLEMDTVEMFDSFSERMDEQSRSRLRRMVTKADDRVLEANRRLLMFLTRIMFIRLQPEAERAYKRPVAGRKKSEGAARAPLWPNLIMVLYIVCSIRIGLNCYAQYLYDFSSARLDWLAKLNAAAGGNETSSKRDELLRNEANQKFAKRLLESLGAPLLNWTFIGECHHLVLLFIGFLTYFYPIRYFRSAELPELLPMRALMASEENNIHIINKAILKQVNKFLVSAEVYFHSKSLAPARFRIMSLARAGGPAKQATNKEFEFIKSKLTSMALSGQLAPLHRSELWSNRLASYNYSVCTRWIYGSIVFNVIVYSLAVLIVDLPGPRMRPMDLVVYVELFVYSCVCVIGCTFSISLTLTTCFDQSNGLVQLRQMIQRTISQNELRFGRYSQALGREEATVDEREPEVTATSDHRQRLVDSLNSRLLLALLHFKTLINQSRLIKRPLRYTTLSWILLAVALPTIIRIHEPYLNPKLKLVTIWVSSTAMAIEILFIWPICYLQCCCQRLYRTLWSLMAHLIEVEESRLGANMYNKHASQVLRKELNHPDKVAGYFTIRILGIEISFPNLLTLLFWHSVLVLTILIEMSSTGQELFHNLLKDPLGVYSL